MLDQLFDFIVGWGAVSLLIMVVAGVTGIIETRRERRGR